MGLDISTRVEARLAAKAKAHGVSIETLLERLINEVDLPATRSGTSELVAIFIGGTCAMTSVEPGILDTNILLYAVDADAPQHASSRALLDAARDAVSTTL